MNITNPLYLENPDRQNILDYVLLKLADNDWKRSSDEHGNCMYRSPDGCNCAVGTLLEGEDHYARAFEQQNVKTMIANREELREVVPKNVNLDLVIDFIEKHCYLLDELQHWHDSSDNVGYEGRLRDPLEGFGMLRKSLEGTTLKIYKKEIYEEWKKKIKK